MTTVKRTLEQILRARGTLATVIELIEIDQQGCDRTGEGRYRRQVFFVVWLALKAADYKLSEAEAQAVGPDSTCAADAAAFDLVRQFRTIGPRNLNSLLANRRFVIATASQETPNDENNRATDLDLTLYTN